MVPAPIEVTNLSDSPLLGSGSLRAAIEAADLIGGVNTINFQVSGTITLTNGPLPITNNDLIIQGPVGGVTIDAHGASGIFMIGDFPGPGIDNAFSVALSGLTLTGGNGLGGAIQNHADLLLTNCTLADNTSGVGGAIFNGSGAALVLTSCTLADNSAGSIGGGIYNQQDAALVLTNCTLADNSAGSGGGGIFNDAVVALANCTLADNSAGFGGGIYNQTGEAVLANCTLADNSAGNGGGIYNPGSVDSESGMRVGTLDLINCTLADNSADGRYGGGGIFNETGTVDLLNCTLADNSATVGGGIRNGLGNEDSIMFLLNTIAADNTPGGDVFNDDTLTGFNNLIVQPVIGEGMTFLINSISADPQLGPLQDNGGPTQTMAIPTSSPAFHAGLFDPLVTTDQRGLPRPPTPSIGAFEPQLSPPPSPSPPSPTGTTIQLTTLDIVPNVVNLTAQVTLTAQVSSPLGTVNEGLVTFTLAGLSVQGTVHNGTANAQVVLPLLELAHNLAVEPPIPTTYTDNSATPLFPPSSAVTPVVLNLWNALLPSTVTLSAGGGEHNAIAFPFTPMEFFYANQVWTAFHFGPLALQVQYTTFGNNTLLTLNGLPQQALFFGAPNQFLGAATLALSDMVPLLTTNMSGPEFLDAVLMALSGSSMPTLLLSDALWQIVSTVPL